MPSYYQHGYPGYGDVAVKVSMGPGFEPGFGNNVHDMVISFCQGS